MMDSLVECCFLLAFLSSTQASIRALCDSADMFWEVREGKQDNTFTCTGLSPQDTVTWILQDTPLGSFNLGSCSPRPPDGSQSDCKGQYNGFKGSRVSDNTSVLVVDSSAASVLLWYGNGRLVCSVPEAAVSCRMDYIYPGKNTSCTVQFSNNSRFVFGQCVINKIRSAKNRYRCEWIQTEESSGDEVLIANTSMAVKSSVGAYFSGSCNFTSHLSQEGQYTYRVTVVPGEVTVNASFLLGSETSTVELTSTTKATAESTVSRTEKSISTTLEDTAIKEPLTTTTKEATSTITETAITTGKEISATKATATSLLTTEEAAEKETETAATTTSTNSEVIPTVNLTCPEYLSEEAIEKVNCSVNTTQVFASSCLPYPATVDFFFQNTSFILLCSASYNGKCDEEPVGEMNCSCVESHDGVNTYQLNFLGNKNEYEGGNLTCHVECYSSLSIASMSGCSSLKYKTTETTPMSTTMETEVTTEMSTVTTTVARKTTNVRVEMHYAADM